MSSKDHIAQEISRMMPKIARHVTLGFTQVFHLTPPQVFTLILVGEMQQCSFSDLSHALRVSAPTVTGIIDRLEKAGYVKRVPSQEDRRVINIQLTKLGHKFEKEIQVHIRKQWRVLLEKLSQKESESYLSIVKKIYARLDQE